MVHKGGVSLDQRVVSAGRHQGIGDFIFASHSGLNVTPSMVSTCLLQGQSAIHAWVYLSLPY